MNILDLPKEILEHILSYNMFPYCISVCRELSDIETDLMNERLSMICNNNYISWEGIWRSNTESVLLAIYYYYDMIDYVQQLIYELLHDHKYNILVRSIVSIHLSHIDYDIYDYLEMLCDLDEKDMLLYVLEKYNVSNNDKQCMIGGCIDRGCSVEFLRFLLENVDINDIVSIVIEAIARSNRNDEAIVYLLDNHISIKDILPRIRSRLDHQYLVLKDYDLII
jgi:hypothetical protein